MGYMGYIPFQSVRRCDANPAPRAARPASRLRFVRSIRFIGFVLPALLLPAGPGTSFGGEAAAAAGAPLRAGSDLFEATRVWAVHLRFTPEQWAAMEPEDGAAPFGAPGAFDPGKMLGMMASRAFMRDGDQNHDGKLSREEFLSLADKWFAAWDKQHSGALTADQLRDGLNETLTPPAPPRMGLQGAEGKRNGLSSMMGIEFKYVHADLEVDREPVGEVGVRYKGNGTFLESRSSLKRSLKVEVNRFVKGQKLAGRSTFNLHNNVTDASEMNEVLAYRLFRDAGVPAPRTAYARVYVTVGGKYDRKYVGLYSLVENVDKHFAAERFEAKGGALFKPVTPALFADLGDDWKSYNQTYDPKTELAPEEKGRVVDLCKLVSHADDATFAAKLGDFIDLDNFSRYLAVTVFLSDLDGLLGPGQNFYLYLHPKTNKFLFIAWDQDHSFGQFKYTQEQRERLSIHHPWEGDNRFLERVFKVEAFKKLYLARLEEFGGSLFKPERFHQQVDELAAAVRPAVAEESDQRLAAFDRAVAGKSPAGYFGFPGGGGGAPKPIKGFVDARSPSVAEQVAGRSEGMTLVQPGFGSPGFGSPGFGSPGAGKPGGPGGLGAPFATPLFSALDANKDGKVTRAEFSDGFGRLFSAWDTDHSGVLSEEQLRSGIGRDLSPFRGRFPFGPATAPSRPGGEGNAR